MRQLFEGLEKGDLARLINTEFSIDEYNSKMGDDCDVIVVSFTALNKNPALDLMGFAERGGDFVLDADVSPGRLNNGEFVVFVEFERNKGAADNIYSLIRDLTGLTNTEIGDWSFKYRRDTSYQPATLENLTSAIPETPEAYQAKFPEEDEHEQQVASPDDSEAKLAAMQEAAGVPMKRVATKDAWTDSIRVAAGLK